MSNRFLTKMEKKETKNNLTEERQFFQEMVLDQLNMHSPENKRKQNYNLDLKCYVNFFRLI